MKCNLSNQLTTQASIVEPGDTQANSQAHIGSQATQHLINRYQTLNWAQSE